MKTEDVYKAVVEVEKLIAGILEHTRQLGRTVDALNETRAEAVQALNDLRRDSDREFVAAKKDIDELRRWTERNAISELKAQVEVLKEKAARLESAQEKIGTRAWSIVPNIVGAIVNVLLAAIVAVIVAKWAR